MAEKTKFLIKLINSATDKCYHAKWTRTLLVSECKTASFLLYGTQTNTTFIIATAV